MVFDEAGVEITEPKFELVEIGNNIIKESVRLDWIGKLIIGPNSCINYEAWIECHTHNFEDDEWPDTEYIHTLIIQGQVYIGARAIILGGCKFIAEGVLVGAGAIVTKDITEPWTKWAGNPARKIGDRKKINSDFSKYLKEDKKLKVKNV